jgi:outer membrane protein assembly factor BamB
MPRRAFALAFLLVSVLSAADWPQILGPDRNGTTVEAVAPWPAAGPRLLWKRPVGPGFAGPAIANGRLLLHSRQGNREILESFDLPAGKLIWTAGYTTAYRDDFGFDEGPRAVPTIYQNRVFTFGAEGVLAAWDLASGKALWSVPVAEKYKVPKNWFGAGGSPLAAGSLVLINAGGAGAGAVAFDAASGREVWRAANDGASYSSGTLARVAGRDLALFLTREGLLAVDPANGAVAHQMRWRARSQASVNAATPLAFGDEIFLTASYATGAVVLRASPKEWTAVWSNDESLSSHYATPVLYNGHLYGFHGRQEQGPALRCVEWKTGKVLWSEEGFGAGTLLLAGQQLLVLRESGELLLAPATPAGFRPVGKAKLLPGTVRAYPALASGTLCARNEDTLACWDVRSR